MMQYKIKIPNEANINYLKALISKVFKLLPMKEESIETANTYLESLLIELLGYKTLFDDNRNDHKIVSVISTLNYLLHNDVSHKAYKREIFKCIKCIERLIEEAS